MADIVKIAVTEGAIAIMRSFASMLSWMFDRLCIRESAKTRSRAAVCCMGQPCFGVICSFYALLLHGLAKLRGRKSSHQTLAQLMAAILARAAGR
jgi:hypothetical protein